MVKLKESKKTSIYLTEESLAVARKLGNGSVSLGIREALKTHSDLLFNYLGEDDVTKAFVQVSEVIRRRKVMYISQLKSASLKYSALSESDKEIVLNRLASERIAITLGKNLVLLTDELRKRMFKED